MTLLLGVLLLGPSLILLPATLRVRGRVPVAIAGLVFAAATVVLTIGLLSLLYLLTAAWIVIVESAVALIVLVVWWRAGAIAPWPWPWVRSWVSNPGRLQRLRSLARGSALVPRTASGAVTAVAVVVAFAALIVQFYVGVSVAPNNWDSMTYHLSRVAYWLQYDSALRYSGGTARQLGSAPNAEFMIAWIYALLGTDLLAFVVQWISLLGLGVGIFSMARLLKFAAGPSAFAAALFVILPQPIMQSTTTQNDLVVSFFLVAAMFFLTRAARDQCWPDCVVGAAAFGLAVGTKGTALIAAPGILLVVVVMARQSRLGLSQVARYAAIVCAGVVLLGSFAYVPNFVEEGTFGGAASKMTSRQGVGPVAATSLVQALWTFADSPGVVLPPALSDAVQAAGRAVRPVAVGPFQGGQFDFSIDSGIQEDTSAFGLVGFIVLPLLLVWTAFGWRIPPLRRAVALAAISYALILAWGLIPNVWLGRVLMPMVAIGAALFASLGRRAWLSGLALILGCLSLLPSLRENAGKPLQPAAASILKLDRRTQQLRMNPAAAESFIALDALVPADAPLAFVGGEDSWDYPLFGDGLRRVVLRFGSFDEALPSLKTGKVAGLVISDSAPPPSELRGVTQLGTSAWFVPASAVKHQPSP